MSTSSVIVIAFLILACQHRSVLALRMGDEPQMDPTLKGMPDSEGGGHLLRGIMHECVVGSAVSILTGYGSAPGFSSCLRAHVAESVARTDDAKGIIVSPSLSAEVDPRVADAGKGRMVAGLLSSSTLMDAANAFFETRAFRWHLDGLYPGLILRLSPSISRGDLVQPAILEFIMDDKAEHNRQHHANDRAYGQGRVSAKQTPFQETGRLLLKKAILPLLLGLKLKVTTIFPILFAMTALLASKALFVGKIALLLAGVIGLGVVLFPGGLAGLAGLPGLGALGGILPYGLGGLGGPYGPYGPPLYDRPYGLGVNPANPLLQYSASNGPSAFNSGDENGGGNRVFHHLLYDVHEGGDAASASSTLSSNAQRDVVLPSFGGGRNFAWENERRE